MFNLKMFGLRSLSRKVLHLPGLDALVGVTTKLGIHSAFNELVMDPAIIMNWDTLELTPVEMGTGKDFVLFLQN